MRVLPELFLTALLLTLAQGQRADAEDPRNRPVRGTVSTLAGEPIAGAKVYEIGTLRGSIRVVPYVATAETQADGTFETLCDSRLPASTPWIVALVAGYAPAFAVPTSPDPAPGAPRVARVVVGPRGGTVELAVLLTDQPLPGASVSLLREDILHPGEGAVGRPDGAGTPVYAALNPAAHSDSRGRVRFEHVLPGVYRALSFNGTLKDDGGRTYGIKGDGAATAVGLIVREGQTTSRTLLMDPAAKTEWGELPWGSTSTVSQTDQRAWEERKHTLEARLLGPDGKPTRGTVWTIYQQEGDEPTPTDENGLARVRVKGPVIVWGVTGRQRLFGPKSADWPSDAQLTAIGVSEAMRVPCDFQRVTRVDLATRAAAWVHGRAERTDLVPPEHELAVADDRDVFRPIVHTAVDGADFIAGPFLTASTTLTPSYYSKKFDTYDALDPCELSLAAGAVTSATIALRAPTPGDTGRWLSPWAEKAELVGKALSADAKTPAPAARVIIFSPRNWWRSRAGIADAAGRLAISASRGYTPWLVADDAEPGSPEGPAAVVWLPGQTGAAIVPLHFKQDFTAVLPKPLALRGRVTIAGKPLQNATADLRIIAAARGHGRLNTILSRTVSANSDGTFEISDLTPNCRYDVQAAVSGRYLSAPLTLDVKTENPAPVAFDVPAPGARLTVHLKRTDTKGEEQPLAVRVVSSGPWAAEASRTRLAVSGSAEFFDLEAGPHRIEVEDGRHADIDLPLATQQGTFSVEP